MPKELMQSTRTVSALVLDHDKICIDLCSGVFDGALPYTADKRTYRFTRDF